MEEQYIKRKCTSFKSFDSKRHISIVKVSLFLCNKWKWYVLQFQMEDLVQSIVEEITVLDSKPVGIIVQLVIR